MAKERNDFIPHVFIRNTSATFPIAKCLNTHPHFLGTLQPGFSHFKASPDELLPKVVAEASEEKAIPWVSLPLGLPRVGSVKGS